MPLSRSRKDGFGGGLIGFGAGGRSDRRGSLDPPPASYPDATSTTCAALGGRLRGGEQRRHDQVELAVGERGARAGGEPEAGLSVALSTTTAMPSVCTIASVAAMPSVPGIWMSIAITSGRSSTARRIASAPSSASPTISNSPLASSSAIKTFAEAVVVIDNEHANPGRRSHRGILQRAER